MTLSPLRFGQYYQVALKTGERPEDQAPRERAQALAKQLNGRDAYFGVFNQKAAPHNGVGTGIHKTAMLLANVADSMLFDLGEDLTNLTATRGNPAPQQYAQQTAAFNALRTRFNNLVEQMIVQSQAVDLPEQPIADDHAAAKEYTAKAQWNNQLTVEQNLLNRMRNDSQVLRYTIEQLATLSNKLSPQITPQLNRLGTDIRFQVNYEILKDTFGFDLFAMLRAKSGNASPEWN